MSFFERLTHRTADWFFRVGSYRGYQQNYFFLFVHLGVVFGFVGWAPGLLLEVGCLYVPLVGVVVYVVGVVRGFSPGVTALWVSLVSAAVVGTTCVSAWAVQADSLVRGGLTLDALSGPFVFLSVTLAPLVVLASLDSIRKNQTFYYFWLLLLNGVLVLCFGVSNFLVFYVLFEVLGFPMFLLVGQYGPRPQRIGAAYKFFVYTFGGSAFILPVLVYLYFWVGSTEVTGLTNYQFTEYEQVLFFGLAGVPFAVKVPLVPFHVWLPEAHVEAPTPVSMLLAGLLLKTGGYAFLRFLIPVFPWGAYVWTPAVMTVGVVSVVVGSLYAVVQVDLKRMIAYASVAHMGVVFVGLFARADGIVGSTYLMLAHGYTSAGLFAGVGVLYDRYHTRTVRYYGGLAGLMPVFGILFFVLTLGNLSFPFTGGFVGEFLVLHAVVGVNPTVGALLGTTVFVSLCYSVWLYNRIFHGPVGRYVRVHQDVTPVEFAVVGWCTVWTVGLGFGGAVFSGYARECYLQVGQKVFLE